MGCTSYNLRVGLFGIGLDAYWSQFEGLQQRLEGYLARVAGKLGRTDVEIVNLGLIDTPQKAMNAGHDFRRQDVDLIFLHVTTYALSSTVLPVVQRAKVPVIILNLAPEPAIDYANFNKMTDRTRMTGEWLAHCRRLPCAGNRQCVLRGQESSFTRSLGCWRTIRLPGTRLTIGWMPQEVAHVMSHNRLGLMGHYYGGMLDIYTDVTRQCAWFGGHIEMLEVEELAALREQTTDAQIDQRVDHFREAFDIQQDCSIAELRRAARTSVALDKLVELHELGSMAYYQMGTGSDANEDGHQFHHPG